jgi:hypothetical protein
MRFNGNLIYMEYEWNMNGQFMEYDGRIMDSITIG